MGEESRPLRVNGDWSTCMLCGDLWTGQSHICTPQIIDKPASRDCEHGQLARSCEMCAMTLEVEHLLDERDMAERKVTALHTQLDEAVRLLRRAWSKGFLMSEDAQAIHTFLATINKEAGT